MEKITFRQMSIDDYEKVLNLWKECNLKIEVNRADSYDSITKSIKCVPQLHMVAEQKKEIIGVIIGSYDNRKGYLHRMAVKRGYRRQGIATRLFKYVEAELIKLGARRIDGLIFKDNLISKDLVKKIGYEPAHNVLYITKSITTKKGR